MRKIAALALSVAVTMPALADDPKPVHGVASEASVYRLLKAL